MLNYSDAKAAFIDAVIVDNYIELESSQRAYEQLVHALDKAMKMALLFGRPGTGKTLLLSRLYEQYKYQKDLHFIETPAGSKREFYSKLFTIFTGQPMPSNSIIHFETFIEYCKTIKGRREITVLLDEAQMYPPEILEEIRILSDTGVVKFIISLHKTGDEDLVAREHFESRIWESIELKNADKNELKTYIHKRLLQKGLFEIANQIGIKHINFIYRCTGGNFRECNKILYTAFEIYEYYDKHQSSKITYDSFSMKILEMAAIKLGYIHV
jgi:Cdc6-like AAA superfamily ATPase